MTYSGTAANPLLDPINQMLMSVGQAPVQDTSDPNTDIDIARRTLTQCSNEIQAEGWSFNKEYHVLMPLDDTGRILIPNNMLQAALSTRVVANATHRAVMRKDPSLDGDSLYLYDMVHHTFIWSQATYCDVLWYYDWVELPKPIQMYVNAKACKMFAQRTIGDPGVIGQLQDQENFCKTYALEFDTQQYIHSIFGYEEEGNFYSSYQPYQALRRF